MRRYLPLLAVAVLTAAGCTNFKNYDYGSTETGMIQGVGTPIAKTVAVLPFADQRAAKYSDPAQRMDAIFNPAGDRGSFYLGFFPLFPFGFVEKAEPENSEDFVTLGRFHFNPQQDLANSALVSLNQARLFAKVSRASDASQTDADYLFQGVVTDTRYNGEMLSYCITYFFAPALWAVGFPNGVSHNQLAVSFLLTERKSGRVVWRQDFRARDYIVHWLYARVGKDADLYAELMKRAMNQAVYSLQQKRAEF